MATTTATETKTAPAVTQLRGDPTGRRPKDNLKSTWRTWDKSRWDHHQWFIHILGLHPTNLKKEIPVHQKTDKMPYLSHFEGHKWIIAHAVWPILLHQAIISWTGKSMHPVFVFLIYTLAFKINAIHELNVHRELGHKYGYLDGDKHERDQVPDASVDSIMRSLVATSTFRPMMTTFLAYRRASGPTTMSWWVPIEIGLYAITLDFWFYWYHRAMHEVNWLWQFHRTHHLTKHPTPLFTLFADFEQEIFDIAIIPLLALGSLKLMGFPMGFYDWWMCHQYVVMTELWGHTGLRVWYSPPTPATPLLKLLGGELNTEDHDLHHRQGWKKSYNYGKQTLLWDKIFGTTGNRIEMSRDNVDWTQPISLPLFTPVK